MTFDELKKSNLDLWEWRVLLETEQTLIKYHHARLDRAFHVTAHFILTRTLPDSDELLDIISDAVSASRTFGFPGKAEIPDEILTETAAARELLNTSVTGKRKIETATALREILRSVMFLGAVYSSLMWLSRCGLEELFDSDANWMLYLFGLRK